NAVSITPHCKKIPQKRRRAPFTDAPVHIRSMMAGGLREYAGAVIDAAPLLIGRAVIEPPEPRKRDGPRTHGTGFQRHMEITADQPFRSQNAASLADGEDFGMGGRVFQL